MRKRKKIPKPVFIMAGIIALALMVSGLQGSILPPDLVDGGGGLVEQAATGAADSQQRETHHQRMRENIATLRLLRMTKALDLTEEQAAKIFPMANRIEREKMEINRKLSQEIRELRPLITATPADEGKIQQKIQAIRQLREALRAKDAEFEAFLDNNLTVVQKGRYILFSLDFAQFLAQNVERARALHGVKPQPKVKKSP